VTPSYAFGLAAGPYSAVVSPAVAAGFALPIGRDLLLKDSDLVLTGGDLSLVRDLDAIAQEAEISMRFWLGEWFLDVTKGIPYLQKILVKSPNLNSIRAIFTDAALGVAGVSQVLTMDLTHDVVARKLRVRWSASTDLGLLAPRTFDLSL